MNVRIFAVYDILDDGSERRLAEVMTVMRLRTRLSESSGSGCVIVMLSPSFRPSRNQADSDNPASARPIKIASNLVERRDDAPFSVAEQDAGMCAEALGPADLAILAHEHDGLVLSIEADPPHANAVRS